MYSTREIFEVDGKHYPIVTALPRQLNNLFSNNHNSLISHSKIRNRLFDYRNLMPFYPLLCRILRKKIQKVIASSQQPATNNQLIISSFAAVKNIVPCCFSPLLIRRSWGRFVATLYLHSPMQYIRENYSEYNQKLTGVKKRIFVLVSKYLRPRDKAPRQYDHIIYNSHYTKSIAENIYTSSQQPAASREVIYPKVNPLFFSTPVAKDHEILDYVVYVGRLVKFIRETDLVIKLANELALNLIILGDGPDADYLKSIA
jgi:glycosyltransferase involved in cell wall biosynthesis